MMLYAHDLTALHGKQSSAENESDPKKGKGLASKVMKMKEDITREVLARVTAMADREEKAVLMTAINALNKSDSTRAQKVHARCSQFRVRGTNFDSDTINITGTGGAPPSAQPPWPTASR